MTDRRKETDIDAGIPNVPKGHNEKISDEAEKLSRKAYPSPSDVKALYEKYPDDETVERILKERNKRFRQRKRQAQEIARKVYNKYHDGSKPFHEILEKMKKYAAKNKWTNIEYDEFRKELSYLLTGVRALEIDYNQNLLPYRSKINRALGGITIAEERGLNIKESEHGVLAEILSMLEKSSPLHKAIFMLSLMYEDCSIVAMTGEYKRDKHIASNYIHPLIACMFLPKFDIFEMQMLYSNFGSIIKCRHEKKPIVNEADAMLLYDICVDPNDVVCEINSPITDIRNRYRVQIKLWETVLNLRNGKYYEDGPISEFITALNVCRNNLYDNADLAFNQDEGALLRRLLSVFSLRPTIIYTKPIYALSSFMGCGSNPFGFGFPGFGLPPLGTPGFGYGVGLAGGVVPGAYMGVPFQNQPVYTVTSIPMITLQIPPYSEGCEPVDLKTATKQTLWVNENKTIVPKEQTIIYSKEVLIFYVNRRIQRIRIKTFTNPLPFSKLPLTMSNFEELNEYPINVPSVIDLGKPEETYQLRSIVAITETEIRQGERIQKLITGSNGLIMTHRNFDRSIFEPRYYLYDPFGASLPVRHPELDGYFTNKPISSLEPFFTPPIETTGNVWNKSFFDRAQTTGTIYIYAKPSGYNPSEIISL